MSRREARGVAGFVGVVVLSAATMVPVAAQAAPKSVDYTCDVPGLGSTSVPVSIDASSLPTRLTTGRSVATGVYAGTVSVTIPAEIGALMKQYLGATSIGGASTDARLRLGTTSIGLTHLSTPQVPIVDGEDTVLTATPKTARFTVPAPGAVTLKAPSSFSLDISDQNADLGDASCVVTHAAGAGLATVTVVKQTSRTTGRAAGVKKGQRPKISVSVSRQLGGTATGSVSAAIGGTKVSARLVHGKAVLTLPKAAAKGRKTVRVTYAGSAATAPSSTTVTFTVS